MSCKRCGGFLNWEEKVYPYPAHWRCVNCGERYKPGDLKEKLEQKEPDMESIKTNPERGREEAMVDNVKSEAMKNCRKCGPKPITEFSKNKTTSDGLEYLCKKCKADYAAGLRARKLKEAGNGGTKKVSVRKRDPYKKKTVAVVRTDKVAKEDLAQNKGVNPEEFLKMVKRSWAKEAIQVLQSHFGV